MYIKYDCHLHSSFSGDSDTPPEKMIERAIALGLEGMCFTEHEDIDAPDTCDVDFTVDFDAYFAKMKELQEIYRNRIQIRIGMEFGLQPHLCGALADLLVQYPFDFIIASQHYIDGKDPYFPSYFEGREEKECYRKFLIAQLENLRRFPASSYDTLGHLDYVVRYGPNQNRFYTPAEYGDIIDPTLRLLIENGKCLEVNTGGLKYGLGETNPAVFVLRRYRELGGERITIGSDAHEPGHLGYEFDSTAGLLRELGFRYYAVFGGRKAEMIKL